MLISGRENLSFGRLYKGWTVQENIVKKNDKPLISELNKVTKLIRKENLHKTKNVDIILQHNKEDGFYGVISSKTQGTPNHPLYKHSISRTDKNLLNSFKKWVKAWDKLYS